MSKISVRQSALLWYVHLLAGLLHIASAATLFALAGNDSWEPVLTTSHEVWSETSCRVGSDNVDRCFEQLRDSRQHRFDVRLVCFLFAFWSGIVHLATILGGRWLSFGIFKGRFDIWNRVYKEDLKKGVSRMRWADYIISASLMITCIGIFAGVTDLYTLVLLALVEALVIIFGAISEKASTTSEQLQWFMVASAAYVVLWIPVLGTFTESIAAIPEEEKTVKNSLYVGISSFSSVYTGFAFIALWNIYDKFKSFYYKELYYIVLSLVSKTLLHWVLFFGLLGRGEQLYNDFHTQGSKRAYEPEKVFIVAGTVIGLGITSAIFLRCLWKRYSRDSRTWIELKRSIPSAGYTKLISKRAIYVQ